MPSAGLQTTFGAGKAKALYIGYYLVQPNQAKLQGWIQLSIGQFEWLSGNWVVTGLVAGPAF